MIQRLLAGSACYACFGLLLTGCLADAKASTVIDVSGAVFGFAGADGLTEGWSTTTSVNDVAITALLANGNQLPSTGTAYLTTSIGPGTTVSEEVAQTDIDITCGLCQQEVALFTGLTLAPGTYWLTLGAPDQPVSYLLWAASNPATLTTGPGVTYRGFDALAHSSFPPSGDFFYPSPVVNSYSYLFSVTGTSVPEPSSIGIFGLGLAILGWNRRRRKLFARLSR